MRFTIDPQLDADTHLLGSWTAPCTTVFQCRLHRNALLPWFIIVPEVSSDIRDTCDLKAESQQHLLALASHIGHAIRDQLDYPRINMGALASSCAIPFPCGWAQTR